MWRCGPTARPAEQKGIHSRVTRRPRFPLPPVAPPVAPGYCCQSMMSKQSESESRPEAQFNVEPPCPSFCFSKTKTRHVLEVFTPLNRKCPWILSQKSGHLNSQGTCKLVTAFSFLTQEAYNNISSSTQHPV